MTKKRKKKQPELSGSHKEALTKLALRSEFKALEKLFLIEEENIVIQSFKINSSDPDIGRKKAWQEGRLWELRKILRTFDEAKKIKEAEDE